MKRVSYEAITLAGRHQGMLLQKNMSRPLGQDDLLAETSRDVAQVSVIAP
jgi:hypothetical protein